METTYPLYRTRHHHHAEDEDSGALGRWHARRVGRLEGAALMILAVVFWRLILVVALGGALFSIARRAAHRHDERPRRERRHRGRHHHRRALRVEEPGAFETIDDSAAAVERARIRAHHEALEDFDRRLSRATRR